MNRRSIFRSAAYAAFFTFVLTTSFACGGGGDSGASGILTATFVPDTPSPGANTVSMQAGAASATDFNVRIAVTDTNDVYGAAFDVTYDAARISYQSYDASGSFLRDGGIPSGSLSFIVDAVSTPGRLIVSATRLNVQPGVDVTGTRDLIVLRFRARTSFAATPIAFDAAQPRVLDDNLGQPIAVTWSSGAVSAVVN